MPFRTKNTYTAPEVGTRSTKPHPGKPRKAKPVKVSVPYAPTRKGKEAEEAARGKVEVPYAPTPTGKAAERAGKRERRAKRRARAVKAVEADQRQAKRKARRIEDKALSVLRQAPPPPAVAVQQAKLGVKPPESKQWRKAFPQAAKQADLSFARHLAKQENLGEPEDITHAIEAASLVAGGVGAAKLAIKGGEEVAAELGTKAATKAATSAAGTVSRAARSIKGGVKARAGAKVENIRTAPARAGRRIKETPGRIKSAPSRARRAVRTSEGRRAAGKAGLRKARRHPVRSGYGAAAISPVPLPGELDKRARAFAKGTAAALTHPGKVAETTGHGAVGFLTAPLGIAGAGIESVKKGSTEPLRHEIRDLTYVPADKTGTGRPGGIVGMTESLASGDPKRVEQTTLQETGLVPFIPVPHVIRRVKGTRAYEETRGKIRGKVEGKRATKRARRMDEAKATAEEGGHVTRKQAKRIKHPVRDTARPGNEHYVNRALGKFIEKQRSRHYISREDARMRSGEIAGRIATESVAKRLRRSKGTNQSEINHGEALRILGKHGIPVNERGYAFVKRVAEGYPAWKPGDTPFGAVLDRNAAKYVLDHPEVFKDRRIAEGLETLNKRSAEIGGHSARNQYLAQVDNLINPILAEQGRTPILKPEEMITPEAVRILPKRDQPWNRSEALSYAKELREVKGAGREKALRQAQALTNNKQTGALDGLMKPPEHGGAEGGVSTTRAVAWTPEMETAFVKAARREGKGLGLTSPTPYLADKFPKGLGEALAPAFKAEVPLNKIWPSRGIAAKSGNALADLESTLYHSLEVPLRRKATVKGFNRIMDNIARPVEGKHVFTTRQAERLTNMGKVPDGTLFVRRQALRALLEEADQLTPEAFSAAVAREIEIGQKLSTGEEIASALRQADEMGLKGDKVVPVDSVAMHELMGQLNGPMGVSAGVGRATNFASRAILNSPAFEISQFAQEGLPMAAALAKDVVNVPKAIAAVKQIKDFPPEIQAEVMVAAGSSSGLMGIPTLKALRSEGYLNPARIAARPRAWQTFWHLANGNLLGRFDRARAGLMRETAAIAKIEGDFKRAEKGFQLWRSSANNLFKDMEGAVEAMRGMNAEERAAYVASHPQLGDRLAKSMNGLAGNWNSFTVFEKNIAPFTMFYAFQRYSVLWTLYHFPLDHPVVATALAMAGEVNAQELQRIAAEHDATPSVLDYAKPVIDGHVLPAGARFSTVLGAPQSAILQGKPTAALGALPPPLSIPLEAAVGKSFYTGGELGENGWAYILRQTGNLSPLARFFGLPDLGKGPPSPGSQVFEQEDPLRTERSVWWPFVGQSAEQFGREKKLEKAFREREGEGNVPYYGDSPLFQKIRYGHQGSYNPNPQARRRELAEALRKIHGSEAAANYLKRREEPFYPSSRKNPKGEEKRIDKEIREAFENAYLTGPSYAKPKKGRRLGGGVGGYSLSGGSVGGGVGGSSGGGIGGYSLR
jgi:hypothetical protein